MIGKRQVHVSHQLMHFRGVWWCRVCGSYCAMSAAGRHPQLKHLQKRCKGSNKVGKHILGRLDKGLPPRAHMTWPLPLPFVASIGIERASSQPAVSMTNSDAGQANDIADEDDENPFGFNCFDMNS